MKKTFEEAMIELGEIVKGLENGDLPLDKAIETYQKGLELTKLCHEKLKEAQNIVVKIINDNGEEDDFNG